MGLPREAPPAKLFAGIMHRPEARPEALLSQLSDLFGSIDLRSGQFPFDRTDYYRPEMGPGLVKFFVSFGPPVPQDSLPGIKLRTNDIEAALVSGGRVFNVDPGLVTLSSVILATTKGHAHRVYMGAGIYEEVTLLFRHGRFEPLPWTYPDYRDARNLDFLGEVREVLRGQLDGGPPAPA